VHGACVNKQGRHQSPEPAVHEIVVTKDEILLGKRWSLLPGPNASSYASEYQEKVGFQEISS